MDDDVTEEDNSLDSGKRGHDLPDFWSKLSKIFSTIRYGYYIS